MKINVFHLPSFLPSGLYALAMNSQTLSIRMLFCEKKIFFLYDEENNIHYCTEHDIWLYHIAHVETGFYKTSFIFRF